MYTLITRNPDPLFRAGIGGVMFFVRAAGVRVRVKGTERSRRRVCFCRQSHQHSGRSRIVGAIPRRIAILLKNHFFAAHRRTSVPLAHFIPIDAAAGFRHRSLDKATEELRTDNLF